MLKDPLSKVVTSVINHLLQNSENLQTELKQFSGKLCCLKFPLFQIDLLVTDQGNFQACDENLHPEVSLDFPMEAFLKGLPNSPGFRKKVRVEGNADFAATLSNVFSNLNWDYEEDLSRVFGDILAHRVIGIFQALKAWSESTSAALSSNLGDYLTQEALLLVSAAEVESYAFAVDEQRDALEKLKQRIYLLERQILEIKRNPD